MVSGCFVSAISHQPVFWKERAKRFELLTFSLARRRSTAELRPLESAESQTRTGDPLIFSQMLYQLSYLGLLSILSNATPILLVRYDVVKL
jgi:hypothetical protein